jgi:hypothetical protein
VFQQKIQNGIWQNPKTCLATFGVQEVEEIDLRKIENPTEVAAEVEVTAHEDTDMVAGVGIGTETDTKVEIPIEKKRNQATRL